MRLPVGGVLADAAALWRAERDVIVRIAGVFLVLPILALAMLATGLAVKDGMTPEQVRELVAAFYAANIAWVLLISLALDFGGLALMKLFAQRDVTVRELLIASLTGLFPYALLGFANGALIQLGVTLFVVPGIYVFGRSWMMGAAFAARPDRGLLTAVGAGFKMSSGNGWRIAMLGIGTALITGSCAFVLVIITQALAVLTGEVQAVQALLMVPVAVAGAAGLVAFTLVRVAIYRRLAGSISGT